jgi:hypothetical protein
MPKGSDEGCVLLYSPFSPQEWVEIIKGGRLVEEIVKIFDIFAQFIDPIDRALAEVLGKKRVKK